eukprot:CAMPEP_0198590910 /NCGR_PEP_ID=MMETSP1462-20131121/136213_1 /TAXON_ID=1333877 /ORGANISM="Brandtodinium nutriculum, Strain RCC3387" /LENGTH=62 /DNA_ID=CAMNT_0044322459 /DNA_START=14 /DNA_END=199 /DNA_ORIENTATION=-
MDSQRDFDLGTLTRRFMSASTRAGTSRSGGTRRSATGDEEEDPLLSADHDVDGSVPFFRAAG